jgi:hypothetical protein
LLVELLDEAPVDSRVRGLCANLHEALAGVRTREKYLDVHVGLGGVAERCSSMVIAAD